MPLKDLEARAAYDRARHHANRERNNKRRRQWDIDNRERAAQRGAQWVIDNKDRLARKYARYYGANKERIAARKAARYRDASSGCRDRAKELHRRDRDNLSDVYVKKLLTCNNSLKSADLPQELIEAKRIQMKLKRGLKND